MQHERVLLGDDAGLAHPYIEGANPLAGEINNRLVSRLIPLPGHLGTPIKRLAVGENLLGDRVGE
ncbi:hypothetical protein D3C87_1028010 [compost metagenome]